MTILILAAAFVAFLLWYALHGRDWLKQQPFAQGFFEFVEPIEILLFKKSETILFARTLSGLGVVLTFLQQFDGINLAPILPLVPEAWQGVVTIAAGCLPLVISLLGMVVEWLRNRTTKPIELVAVPDKVVAENPAVAKAVAQAEVSKDAAVAVAAEAKAAA
jgi:hypothetical protein